MIRDTESGLLLTARQLVGRIASASHVWVGAQHDNPEHSALQLWLLHSLAELRPQGSLLLEMLTSDQQARIDTLRSDIGHSLRPEDLPTAMHWQERWAWSLYGPLMRFALAQPYPLLAAGFVDEIDDQGIQSLAQGLLAAPVPALLFADARLARKDPSIARHLPGLDGARRPVVLILARTGEDVHPQSADYVWFTAALSVD